MISTTIQVISTFAPTLVLGFTKLNDIELVWTGNDIYI